MYNFIPYLALDNNPVYRIYANLTRLQNASVKLPIKYVTTVILIVDQSSRMTKLITVRDL